MLMLIDAASLWYRAYYGLPSSIKAPDGRRSGAVRGFFDGLAVLVVDCDNLGSPTQLVTTPPAPQHGTTFHYDSMIHRIAGEYAGRFAAI